MRTQSPFYSRVFSLAVAAVLGYTLWRIFAPLLNAMSWAMFLAFLLHPVNLRLRRRLRGKSRAAGVLTVLTPIVILLPLSALSVAFVTEASALVRTLQQRARALDIRSFSDLQQFPLIARANDWLQAHAGVSADQLQNWLVSATQELLQQAAGLSGWFFLGAVGSVIGFSLMLFLLFFFLRDGDAMCQRARGLIPLDEERKDRLFRQLSDVARAIVLGTTLTALIQGVLVGIGMAIAGLPSPVVFGVLVALLAMLPMGGAGIVWVPAVGWLLYDGRWGYAIFMLAWGLMVSGLESVLRPILISGRARISALSIFVGVLGGIAAFGAIGIIVGPVVLSLVLALIEFAEETADGARAPSDSQPSTEVPLVRRKS
ncbi:MAG TPA: AI-2E family transporter [Steroidobacteraceae bacterium]|nr:AI-2E family transporter [Steroidobacteraceae bacterium]